MKVVHPYLYFNGNAENAFTFYKSVFGGEFIALQRYKVMADAKQLSQRDQNKIQHIALPLGPNGALMGSDKLEDSVTVGDNLYITIHCNSRDEAEQLFKGLSHNGEVLNPLHTTFWGAYFGDLIDPFGVRWIINFEASR